MTFTPHGHHLIGGKQVSGEERFRSAPATGDAFEFSAGSPDLVAQACAAAHARRQHGQADESEDRRFAAARLGGFWLFGLGFSA